MAKKEERMNLHQIRIDCARGQRRGIHFIGASVPVWTMLFAIHASDLPVLTKNLYTFLATAALLPLAVLLARILGIRFKQEDNPLSALGILLSFNQMLYL